MDSSLFGGDRGHSFDPNGPDSKQPWSESLFGGNQRSDLPRPPTQDTSSSSHGPAWHETGRRNDQASSVSSTSPNGETPDETPLGPARELGTSAREHAFIGTGWLDFDNSGDYDPAKEPEDADVDDKLRSRKRKIVRTQNNTPASLPDEQPRAATTTSQANSTSDPPAPAACSLPTPPPPALESTVPATLTGDIAIIDTMLAHPITFNAAPPCDWCENPLYGLFGLGLRSVKVQLWADGKGCTELGGGHRADGTEESHMCADCTARRVDVSVCERHELRGVARPPMADASDVDAEEAAAALLEAYVDALTATAPRTPARHAEEARWCSICPAPAVVECAARADDDDDEGGRCGCGLCLCEPCAIVLEEVYALNVAEMVAHMEVDEEFWPLGLRADVDCYRADGFMMRQILG